MSKSFVRRALVALGLSLSLVAGAATPAMSHNEAPDPNLWPVFQDYRTAYTNSGGGSTGGAQARTRWLNYAPTGQASWFAFDIAWVADFTNNGSGDCTELWVDFNRAGQGSHRNPSMFRACNTGNGSYKFHVGLSDRVQRGPNYVGWDITVCRSIRQGDGRWIRRDCTNELGNKPMTWVESNDYFNGPATGPQGQRYGRFDWEIGGCNADFWYSPFTFPGCVAYTHFL